MHIVILLFFLMKNYVFLKHVHNLVLHLFLFHFLGGGGGGGYEGGLRK